MRYILTTLMLASAALALPASNKDRDQPAQLDTGEVFNRDDGSVKAATVENINVKTPTGGWLNEPPTRRSVKDATVENVNSKMPDGSWWHESGN
ncbi:hypothetical protein ASPBRDRAFT_200965 [Aspergillus brasiliensis CBS 101740]|uniref:Pectate lyase n=1 Tax=Aspergillus brasiliensis (strain CBS 101740 / IMI 381727 / IBT 21946) TaxID=767769 RepID=A0A1L9U3T3_ASPBC|nr:hypothetical protein ASPBRDRAFT_200965 [Aspergillus brasiliensis CBS 101740]